MNKERKHFGITYNDKEKEIYVFGGCVGQENTQPIKTCGKFLVDKNQWKKMVSMEQNKSGVSACIVNYKFIYLIGGENEEEYLNDIEKYNIAENTMETI